MTREEVFDYVDKKYQTNPEYLWRKYPTYAVLRHRDNNKWFAIAMNVSRSNIGLAGDAEEEILDVKLSPKEIEIMRTFDGFLPAYHMNKRNWITVRLNKVTSEQIAKLITASFELTAK